MLVTVVGDEMCLAQHHDVINITVTNSGPEYSLSHYENSNRVKRNFLQSKEDQKTRRAIIAKFASEVFKDKNNDPLGRFLNN